MLTLLFILALLASIAGTVFASLKFSKTTGNYPKTEVGFRPFGLVGILAILLVIGGWNGYTTVDSGTIGVVTRFGKTVDTLQPGLHFINPLNEVHPIATRTLVVKPSEDASTKDLQTVHMEVTLAYHFDPSFAGYFYSQLQDATPNAVENKVIIPAVLEAMKAKSSLYDAPELVTNRAIVRDGIETYLQGKLAAYHIVPETVSITDFRFSKEYDAAIEAKQTAQQNAEKAANELVTVKVEAQKAEAVAKGTAAANVANAQGEATAILAKATAQAEANRKLASSITPELILNKAIEKWDGVRPMVEGGKAGLLLQLPATHARKGAAEAKDDDNQ